MLYRREIDGLRSFAVLPVILFHAGFSLFSGGFVGVDVFFVISGFLITSIIIEEMKVGRFSILGFYERRARRILPALFFVMLISIPFAWMLLSPSDLHDFAQSLVSIALFGSNFLFWQESGYFDTAAELKPMLHTWSLAVEEQYYVLFPLLILLAWRFGTRLLVALIAVIAGASLVISEVQVQTQPSTAFFLLPARAWQLLVGSLAAFLVIYSRRLPLFLDRFSSVSELLGALGLMMIVWATFMFSDLMPFPGLNALIPTIGSVLVLLFGTSKTLVGRLLGFGPLVGIGLISYSAYLWHQPIFAFTRHAVPGEVPAMVMLILSALSLGLAYLSWRCIEKPFRSRTIVSRKVIFTVSVAGILAFVGIGATGLVWRDNMTFMRLSGVSSELTDTFRNGEALRAERDRLIQPFFSEANAPFSGDPAKKRILIFGDSVSGDLYGSMMLNQERFQGLEIRRLQLDDRCMGDFVRLLKGAELRSLHDKSCRRGLDKIRSGSLFPEADVLVLNAHWARSGGDRPHLDAMALAEMLAAQGRQVDVVGLLAMKDASSAAFQAIKRGLTVDEANAYAYRTLKRGHIDQPNEDFRALAARAANIRYLDKYALFCNDKDEVCALYDEDRQLQFSDTNHVSGIGAVSYGKRIAEQGWFESSSP